MSSENLSSEALVALIVASTSILVALIGHAASSKKNLAEIKNINAQTKKIILESKKISRKPERKIRHMNFKVPPKKKNKLLLYGSLMLVLPLVLIFLFSHGNQEDN